MSRRRAELARPRTFRRDGHSDPTGPPSARTLGELEAFQSLAAGVIFQAWYDCGIPQEAARAAAWLLEQERRTIWAQWAPIVSTSRRFRDEVLSRVAMIVRDGRGPHAQAAPASPRVRAVLKDLIRRHVGDDGLAALLAAVPAAPVSRHSVEDEDAEG